MYLKILKITVMVKKNTHEITEETSVKKTQKIYLKCTQNIDLFNS